MAAYVEGDAEAFERLLQRVGPSLRAFLARSAGDRAAPRTSCRPRC